MELLDTEVTRERCEYCDAVLLRDGWDGQYYDEKGIPIELYDGPFGSLKDEGITCCSEDCFFDSLPMSRKDYYREERRRLSYLREKDYGWEDDYIEYRREKGEL